MKPNNRRMMPESEKWGLTADFRNARNGCGGNSLSVPFFPARLPAFDFS
jgi:hypothetical protein